MHRKGEWSKCAIACTAWSPFVQSPDIIVVASIIMWLDSLMSFSDVYSSMDEDDECKALRQVVEERCPGAKFKDSDIKKLVDAGYDTETALGAASKDSLNSILSTRPGVVDVLFRAFVQPAGMFSYLEFVVWVIFT